MNKFIKYFTFLLLIVFLGIMNVYGDDEEENNNEDTLLECYYQGYDEDGKEIVSKISLKSSKTCQNNGRIALEGGECSDVKSYVSIAYGEDTITNKEIANLKEDKELSNIGTINKIVEANNTVSSCPVKIAVVDSAEAQIYAFTSETSSMFNKLKQYYKSDVYELNNVEKIDIEDNKIFGKLSDYTCRDLLGEDIVDLINKYYGLVYILVPILVIVLGFMDFGSAILQSNADEMKKSSKKFIKRLVMGIVVMMLPTILNIIFYIVNFAKDPSSVDNYFNYINSDSCIESD